MVSFRAINRFKIPIAACSSGFRRVAGPLLRIVIPVLWLGCGVTGTVHAQDAYLDALAEEADHLDDSPSDGAARNLGGMPKGLDLPGFEDAMKKKFFGSFLFYSKLTDEQKQLAYETYRQDNDIEPIRKKIMDLFSGN